MRKLILPGIVAQIGGSGGSGTTDYNDLSNKPAIDGVKLTSSTTKEDLGLGDELVPATDTTLGGVKVGNGLSITTEGTLSANVTDVKVDNVSVLNNTVAEIDLSKKQDKLVSGTNIKTINGQSLLGSGNIKAPNHNLCDLYELVLDDEYHTDTLKLETFVGRLLRLESLSYGLGAIIYRAPSFTISPYQWSGPDASGFFNTTATVTVSFIDGSTLVKEDIRFTTGESHYRLNNGLMLSTNSYIDTGLTLNGAYKFKVTGHTIPGNQSSLVGAFSSTANRTTTRILGGSQKIQAMWPYNREFTQSTTGIDFTKMLTYTIDSNTITIEQDSISVTYNISGDKFLIDSTVPILLLNESRDGAYYNGVLSEAQIWDENGNLLRHFQSWHIDGDDVMMDIANGDQIYLPATGKLIRPDAI